MKKFIKYNLLFVVTLFTFCIFSISIKAEYVVNIKDGCIYKCALGPNDGACKNLVSQLKWDLDDKYNAYWNGTVEYGTGNQTRTFVKNMYIDKKSYRTQGYEYLKHFNFYYYNASSTIKTSDVKFFLDTDDSYRLHEDLEIKEYLYNDTNIKMVCNKNEDGNIEDRCFPVMGYYGKVSQRDLASDYIGNWGSYKNNPGICESNRVIPYNPDYSSGGDSDDPSEEKPSINSCFDIKDENSCKTDDNFSCIWVNKGGGYCNVDNLQYIKCGDAFDIPSKIPPITSFLINFLKIVTPIVLIIVSIISLVKAIMASKEDEMQKATQGLKRRVIAAAMVFFVISIVQFVIFKVADSSETGSIGDCLSCFINNKCDGSEYFKTNVNGRYECHYLNNINSAQTCPEDEK